MTPHYLLFLFPKLLTCLLLLVIHKVLRYNLLPRTGGGANFTYQDLMLVAIILKGMTFNFSLLMLRNMISCLYQSKKCLPYGRFLTKKNSAFSNLVRQWNFCVSYWIYWLCQFEKFPSLPSWWVVCTYCPWSSSYLATTIYSYISGSFFIHSTSIFSFPWNLNSLE